MPRLLALAAVAFLVSGESRELAVQPSATADRAVDARLATFDEAWRLVRDSHFDPAPNGVDWEALKAEFRPQAAAATSDEALREVITAMMARLQQSHFYVIPRDRVDQFDPGLLDAAGSSPSAVTEESGDVGIDVRLIGGELLVTRVTPGSPAAAAGVRPGWAVLEVAGRRVAGLLRDAPPALERRAQVKVWNAAMSWLRGKPGTPCLLGFRREGGVTIRRMLTRQPTPGQVVRFGNLPPFVARVESERLRLPAGGTAGFIRFNVWMVPLMRDLDVAVEQLGDTDGIVLDLRGNPGGVSGMLIGLAGHFFRERVSLGTMRTRESELQLFVNPRLVAASGRAAQPFGGPVAILVDALSFSASELFAGGMQATGRARVFGEPSQGAVLGARFDRLPNGDILGHAMADFLLPTGARLEGRGVQPDTLVRSTRGLLLAGRDAPLDAALDWIANEARKARTRPDHQVAVGWR